MRAVHAIWAMDERGGGTSAAVAGLTDALEEVACPVTLLFGQDRASTRTVRPQHARSIPVRALRLGRHTLSAPGLMGAAREALSSDRRCVIHTHGLWTLVGGAMARLARASAVPLVISPHGMLEPAALAQHRWRKRLALWMSQRTLLEAADLLVAASRSEADNMRRLGLGPPIAVVPHGVRLPEQPASHNGAAAGVRNALFVGRVHPIKGLNRLVEAWARVRPTGWRCQIAGPSELGHRTALEHQVRSHGLAADFEFLGALDASRREELYRAADLFVLPSLSENFGIVVAEALAYGLPVLATRGTPWQQLNERGAGWWVDSSVNGLEQGLRAACTLTPQERAAMGAAGRRLAAAELQWPAVAARMLECYEWLFERNSPAPDSMLL
jgi:glycosyltransferase involved in cell wall biosynthesis